MHLPDQSFFEFLQRLHDNNDRTWFGEHKSEFQTVVHQPAVELVSRLKRPLSRIAPMITAVAKPNGGSVMRIYRDTRFSKDKTPYKDHIGISLKHEAGKQTSAPELYIHLSPVESFVAGGCWMPPREPLAAIRGHIDANPDAWKRATAGKRFAGRFELGGQSLKTSPRDYPSDHPWIEDLRRKSFVGIAPLTIEQIVADDLVDRLLDDFKRLRPLMTFLCEAVGVPY